MRKTKSKKLGGYSYHYDTKTIKKYTALSAKQKLDWLEEANAFSYKFMPGENRKMWEKLRKGEI